LRTSTSQEEGGERHWQIESTAFEGNEQGLLTTIRTRSRTISPDSECTEGKFKDWPCDLALIACGFIGPDNSDELGAAGIALNERGHIDANPRDYKTSQPGVFAAGDMRRGQSLVVWAIAEGRQAASAIHRFLECDKPQDLRKNMYSDRLVASASID
jgi:glutamate synthase (NADPH/NADH) small chain